MSAVVQAKCPGCGNLLRIPANLLGQAFRCKHCQTVMMPRQPVQATPPPSPVVAAPPQPTTPVRVPPTPAPPIPPVVPSQTGGRPKPPPIPPTPAPAPMPVSAPIQVAGPPALPAPAPSEVAVAEPVRRKKKNDRPSVFEELQHDDTPTTRTLRKARKPQSIVVPLILMGLFLAGGGTLLAVFWPSIQATWNGEAPPGWTKSEETNIASTGPKKNGSKSGPATPAGGFPRRALIISVHNYLYANLVHSGPPVSNAQNMPGLVNAINRGLRIPLNQIAHLSDAATRGAARPPLKGVIEKTLTDFVESSRDQDRIMVLLVGHCVDIEDKPHFVPIEGEFEVAETLIPMSWILEQMAACKARQKILVVDVNRENPTYGRERPTSGPMSEALEAMLKAPPEGVQIWSACSKEGLSYETDEADMGIFMASLLESTQRGIQGRIQKEEDLIPLDLINEDVNRRMKESLEPLGLKQTAFVAGSDRDNGTTYDPNEPLAAAPTLAPIPVQQGGAATAAAIRGVLDEISVPPIKVTKLDNKINFAMLPPMADAMKDYLAGGEMTPLRQKVKEARAVLWAVSDGGEPPADLMDMIKAKKDELRVDLSVLQDGYQIPSDETQFKNRVEADERQVAVILGALEEAHLDLKDMEEDKEKETKRWQANYDFVVAHLEAQIAYLYEYQSMLGLMRKEFPEHDPKVHRGWKLASRTSLGGDSTGRKLARSAGKTLTSLSEDHKNTPWEVLAKREKLTALGLEWKAYR